jgi:hypothetical protein
VSYDAIRYQWEKLCRLAECINEDDKLGNVGELISASLFDQQTNPNPCIYFKPVWSISKP